MSIEAHGIRKKFGAYTALDGVDLNVPQGKLVASEINFYNVGRDADELVRKLEAYIYLVNHPDQACPAKWQPGSKTLIPNKNLVGRVAEASQK